MNESVIDEQTLNIKNCVFFNRLKYIHLLYKISNHIPFFDFFYLVAALLIFLIVLVAHYNPTPADL